jgi:23S rRNA (cytosine1962-C5)-methyltransferase
MLPCVIFEDDHLLAVNKPAGWNTHAPSPYAGEGIYDWLRNREPRWAALAIIHRLDKETSGVLVFGKSPLANRSLTEQFTRREVRKSYLLLTDRSVPRKTMTIKSSLARVGDKYASRSSGEPAETRFLPAGPLAAQIPLPSSASPFFAWEVEPLTGRTHQIRVQAAESGFPILGDTLYGGTPAARVFLHARDIRFKHPATGGPVHLSAPADFAADARLTLRAAIIEPGETDAYRLIHGASDGWPGWFVDRLGRFLLSQSDAPLTRPQLDELERLRDAFPAEGAYHKILSRQVRRSTTAQASPQLALGSPASGPFTVIENGARYEMSFSEGYSTGLFLDQRDNRRRLMALCQKSPASPGAVQTAGGSIEVLNVFAYTCGFSVCAAKAGARATSLDLSKKYLEWGRRNFALNGLDPGQHDFIYGDAFDWLRRLAKKGRAFDLVVLDPPTFSQSKESGVFRVEADYGDLVVSAAQVLKPRGRLFVSANTTGWPPEEFVTSVRAALRKSRRDVAEEQYYPQPPDFPISRAEPAYLKTMWLRAETGR